MLVIVSSVLSIKEYEERNARDRPATLQVARIFH